MPTRINIPKEKLEKLYWQDELSTNQIAKHLNLSKGCIQQNMNRQKIKKRARLFALRKSKIPSLPKKFSASSYSFDYLMGVSKGDGTLTDRALQLFVKDKDFIMEFKKQAKQLGLNPTTLNYRLKNEYPLHGSQVCNKTVIQLMKKTKPKITIGFINGFIDSEGCVTNPVYYKSARTISRQIRISNTDISLLTKISEKMNNLGINNTILKGKNRQPSIVNHNKCNIKNNIYTISITGKENTKKFSRYFKFSIKRKQERLKKLRRYI